MQSRFNVADVSKIKVRGQYETGTTTGSQVIIRTPDGWKTRRPMFTRTVIVEPTDSVPPRRRGGNITQVANVSGKGKVMQAGGDIISGRPVGLQNSAAGVVTILLPSGCTPEITQIS